MCAAFNVIVSKTCKRDGKLKPHGRVKQYLQFGLFTTVILPTCCLRIFFFENIFSKINFYIVLFGRKNHSRKKKIMKPTRAARGRGKKFALVQLIFEYLLYIHHLSNYTCFLECHLILAKTL
jgi:hypothetical protein